MYEVGEVLGIGYDRQIQGNSRCFFRSSGDDAKGMDFLPHHCSERIIHHAMSFDRAFPAENGRNDGQAKVAASTGASVTHMTFAFIFEVTMNGLQGGELLAYLFYNIHFGRTFLKGRTVTLA